MTAHHITINRVKTHKGTELMVSLVPPNIHKKGVGLIKEQIIGKLLDSKLGTDGKPMLTPDNFARNKTFVEFMHWVIENYGFRDPGIIERAKYDKPIGIVDLRCPENVMPEPEDIIGIFHVKSGVISSYAPNEKHRILSSKGFFQLPPPFSNALLHELARLIEG